MKSNEWAQCSAMLVRVVVGIIFVLAGIQKLFYGGAAGVAGMLSGVGIPLAKPLAYLVGTVELLGGLMLIVGAWVWLAGLLLAITMAVASILHIVKYPGMSDLSAMWGALRLPLLLLVLSLWYMGHSCCCSLKQSSSRPMKEKESSMSMAASEKSTMASSSSAKKTAKKATKKSAKKATKKSKR